jgi:hypothetical protein
MKFSWSDQHAAWPDGHGIALKIKAECKMLLAWPARLGQMDMVLPSKRVIEHNELSA